MGGRLSVAGFEYKEADLQGPESGLCELRATSSQKRGPQAGSIQEMSSFQQPEWAWKWIFSAGLQKRTYPASHLEGKALRKDPSLARMDFRHSELCGNTYMAIV